MFPWKREYHQLVFLSTNFLREVELQQNIDMNISREYNLFKKIFKQIGCDRLAVNEVLAALADDTRRKILLKLKEGKISSGDLAIALDMTPQALSYHLSKLKKADLIYETRYKNFIYYELNLSILDETIMWMSNLRGGQQ